MSAQQETPELKDIDINALPPLPKIAQEVLAAFGDEFIDGDKVVAVIEGDPSLCARLLGIANSAYYSLAEPLDSIQAAVTRVIGVETVRSLVLALTMQKTFDSGACPGFNTERFWRHSLFCAQNCSDIAQQDKQIDDMTRKLAYSTGLCHNLGLMALAHLAPKRTSAVLIEHNRDSQPDALAGMLRETVGIDHRAMTATLADKWSLPETLTHAYRYRAFGYGNDDARMGVIVAAAATGASNMEAAEESKESLDTFADKLSVSAERLADLTTPKGRKKDSACSLANRMAV